MERYVPRESADEAALRTRIVALATRFGRYGYFAMGPAQVLSQSFQISGDTVMSGKMPGSVTGVEDAPWWAR